MGLVLGHDQQEMSLTGAKVYSAAVLVVITVYISNLVSTIRHHDITPCTQRLYIFASQYSLQIEVYGTHHSLFIAS